MPSADYFNSKLASFQKKIGYAFSDINLLETALTHSSFANESGLSFHNERLEYLGDAVLELAVSDVLYREMPDAPEGDLTRRRSFFVCKEGLLLWAERVGLKQIIRYGKSIGRAGVTASMEADAAEAVFGAVFLDGGYEKALEVINVLVSLRKEEPAALSDPKTALQELMQSSNLGVPYYRTVERRGPDHALQFKVEVLLAEKTLACAWAFSIKEAEFEAARLALEKLSKKDKFKGILHKIEE